MLGSQFPTPHTSPADFERQVRAMLDAMGHQVLEYRSEHQEVVQGLDGELGRRPQQSISLAGRA